MAASKAYDDVLFALGNNHAGTYYPVAIPAIPFLREILECGAEWSRVTVLDILIDLFCSFEPEPGFHAMMEPDGSTAEVESLLLESIANLHPTVQAIVNSPEVLGRLRELAQELLAAIEEDGPFKPVEGFNRR